LLPEEDIQASIASAICVLLKLSPPLLATEAFIGVVLGTGVRNLFSVVDPSDSFAEKDTSVRFGLSIVSESFALLKTSLPLLLIEAFTGVVLGTAASVLLSSVVPVGRFTDEETCVRFDIFIAA